MKQLLAIIASVASLGLPARSPTQSPQQKKLLSLPQRPSQTRRRLDPAEKAVADWGKTSGFDVTTLKGYEQDSRNLDLSALTPEYLGQFDGLMLMTNGNLPLTDQQRESIL